MNPWRKGVACVSSRRRITRDKHHIFYTRVEYNTGKARLIRYHPYCIVEVPIPMHRAIHACVGSVPVPKRSLIESAVKELDELIYHWKISPYDPIERRLEVLIGIFDKIDLSTAEALRVQLDVVSGFTTKKAPY